MRVVNIQEKQAKSNSKSLVYFYLAKKLVNGEELSQKIYQTVFVLTLKTFVRGPPRCFWKILASKKTCEGLLRFSKNFKNFLSRGADQFLRGVLWSLVLFLLRESLCEICASVICSKCLLIFLFQLILRKLKGIRYGIRFKHEFFWRERQRRSWRINNCRSIYFKLRSNWDPNCNFNFLKEPYR